MKKTFVETERDARSSDKSTSNHEAKKGKILTDSELNALAAKVVKAEILGNESLVQKLKSELEESKRRRSEAETQGMVPNEKTETIILTKTNRQGFTVPADITVRTSSRGECSGKKIRKVDTHESGQRLRYFPDDDKYSLKEMVFISLFQFKSYLKKYIIESFFFSSLVCERKRDDSRR